MSLALSETATPHYTLPKVVAVFLAKFDSKKGYEITWSKSATNINLQGLETKVLPSGVHLFDATTVYLTHKEAEATYYGLARFRKADLNAPGESNRDLVKMYSLGILTEPVAAKMWKPNEFVSLGWEHVTELDEALASFVKSDAIDSIEAVYKSLVDHGLQSLPVPKQSSSSSSHPLVQLPQVLSAVGPLIFPLFKQALLRKRVLIVNHLSQGLDSKNAIDPSLCGALTFVVALISVVPRDVHVEAPDSVLCSSPIYAVGLPDIDSDILTNTPGYIAFTSDEVMKYQQDLFDVLVTMPRADCAHCEVSEGSRSLKATFNDYTKFLRVKSFPSETIADDASSINTSNSLLSALRHGYTEDAADVPYQPQWWLKDATFPMSWLESIWLAFAWFASAGTTTRKASCELQDPTADDRSQFAHLAAIVTVFHKLAKKWFYIVDEIVAEAVDDANGHGKVTLELTNQDIVDMELDPYSQDDLDFVRQFVLLYWSSVVEEVDIGLTIHGFCC